MDNKYSIVSCNGAKHIGLPNTISFISKYFKNGEVYVELKDSVNNHRMFIIQSFSLPNTHLMELLLTVDAAKRSGAKEINVIIPYFPYSRMDKKHRPGVPISAKIVADILSAMNIDRIVTFDLHAEQIQGFFSNNIDFCHVKMGGFFTAHMMQKYVNYGTSDWVFCSPDAGSVKRTKELASLVGNQNLCNMIKYRVKDQEVDSMLIIGDVKEKNVVVFDDMIDTCGTIEKAVDILFNEGAKDVVVMATHGILSKPAFHRLNTITADVYVTDSLPIPTFQEFNYQRIYADNILSILPLKPFIETIINRIINYKRLGDLCSCYKLTQEEKKSTWVFR